MCIFIIENTCKQFTYHEKVNHCELLKEIRYNATMSGMNLHQFVSLDKIKNVFFCTWSHKIDFYHTWLLTVAQTTVHGRKRLYRRPHTIEHGCTKNPQLPEWLTLYPQPMWIAPFAHYYHWNFIHQFTRASLQVAMANPCHHCVPNFKKLKLQNFR